MSDDDFEDRYFQAERKSKITRKDEVPMTESELAKEASLLEEQRKLFEESQRNTTPTIQAPPPAPQINMSMRDLRQQKKRQRGQRRERRKKN
jgi:hypothetical protein